MIGLFKFFVRSSFSIAENAESKLRRVLTFFVCSIVKLFSKKPLQEGTVPLFLCERELLTFRYLQLIQ